LEQFNKNISKFTFVGVMLDVNLCLYFYVRCNFTSIVAMLDVNLHSLVLCKK